MRVLIFVGVCGLFAALGSAQEPVRKSSLTGRIEYVKAFKSETLKNKRDLIIYLPPQYSKEATRRFPVLYMHDGQNIFDGMTSYIPNQEWRVDEAAEALIKAGLIEPIIIVGINNAGMDRGNEYLPTEIKMGENKMGGKADLYGKMLFEEIKPMIDQKYRTRPGRKDTGLCGSSFGGVVSYYLGITRSKEVSKVGVVSPSIWVDNRILIKMTQALKGKLPLKLWVDIGTSEGFYSVRDTRDFTNALAAKGWVLGKDFVSYEENFAGHNELAWSRRIAQILIYLFPAKR